MLLPYHILLASNLRCSIQHRSQWHSLVLHWQKVVVIPNFCAFHCTSRSWLYTNIPYLWPNLLYYHITPSLVLLYSALCLLYIYMCSCHTMPSCQVFILLFAFIAFNYITIPCLHALYFYYHTQPLCSFLLLYKAFAPFIFITTTSLHTFHLHCHHIILLHCHTRLWHLLSGLEYSGFLQFLYVILGQPGTR